MDVGVYRPGELTTADRAVWTAMPRPLQALRACGLAVSSPPGRPEQVVISSAGVVMPTPRSALRRSSSAPVRQRPGPPASRPASAPVAII